MAFAVLATLPVGLAPTPAVAVEAAVTEAGQAQREAAAAGERVEVVGERTERDTVFANPDGQTFTLERSIVPVRVASPDGGWAAPDPTLHRRSDGTIGPKGAAVDLSFSSGGDGEKLVTIGDDGRSVSLGWPGRLPEPKLDGPRVVYEDVRPDVNLILTATVEGFRQVLEVESLEAASDLSGSSLTYTLATDGLRMRDGAAGSMEAVDGNGQVVFRSPSARMWNSAGDAVDSGAQPRKAAAPAAGKRSAVRSGPEPASEDPPARPAGPEGEGDPLAGPGTGDEAAVMEVDVTAETVAVSPDPALIARTTPAELPLYIDPSVELNESERTVLSSDGDVFYNFSGGENGMSVGRCGSAVIGGYLYACTTGTPYTNRMYFEFTPGSLKGKHVLDAEFRVTETWSFSCDARWVDLERTNEISKSTSWPGPKGPASGQAWDQMGDRNVSAGRGSACSPSQPRAAIEFHDNADEPDENLTPTVRSFANGSFSKLTLMLRAKDESDPIAWKRFDDDAVLVVTYAGKPATPTEYGFETGTGQVCSTSASSPTVWSDPTPNLAATPQTASGGESGASLRVHFDVDAKNSDGTWSNVPEPATGALSPRSGYVGDGTDQNKDWDTALAENRQYRYRAVTRSYYNSGKSFLSSGGTPYCYFTVDASAPKPPKITFSSVYGACLPGACAPRGAPGTPGTVSFGPADGSKDVNTAYSYRLSTDSAWRPWKTGATVSETITPVDSGTITLDVRAKDAVGRTGQNTVRFLVAEGAGPVGRWTFNESSGAAIDVSAAQPAQRDDAALSAATRVSTGRRGVVTESGKTAEDKALRMSGQAYAATAGRVLETQASYSVAAWVRLDSTGRAATVLGQDGAHQSAFFLGYCEGAKTWCLRLPDADAVSTALDNQRVEARERAALGVWTHLAAVVDTGRKTLTLYVNGVPQGSDTLTTGAWSSTGPLQIGRVKYRDAYVDHFPGEVDEVAVWQSAQLAEFIAREASPVDAAGKAYAELVAHYAPAGAGGSSLPDLSGYGRDLALAPGAGLDGEGLAFDGVSGSAESVRPIVDGSGSFTVSTEVAVASKALLAKPDGHRAQVVGQRTETGSSWSLWLEKTGTAEEPVLDEEGNPVLDDQGVPRMETVPVGRWHFGRLTGNGTGASVVSDEVAVLDAEVGLVGAYDARKRTLTLYVGSSPQAEPLSFTASTGTGQFSTGRAWVDSAWGNHLTGRITDVRLWAGAMTDAAQVESLVGY
ncbi:LamG domain-containing protein [Streptomyces lichenis]|uniref:LamG domain-containing protein n=1 Tax=Streptomyces lichenis TaxID=2306967 RepID=A0ABT0IF18_9ACTN|nr:LamG domain-containing protein [Streptomyces lichenis]MCK8679925.1 LamG domain-containing protein [Streptomyces lichenis]